MLSFGAVYVQGVLHLQVFDLTIAVDFNVLITRFGIRCLACAHRSTSRLRKAGHFNHVKFQGQPVQLLHLLIAFSFGEPSIHGATIVLQN